MSTYETPHFLVIELVYILEYSEKYYQVKTKVFSGLLIHRNIVRWKYM